MEINSSITEGDLMDYCEHTMITILWNGKWVALKLVNRTVNRNNVGCHRLT